MQKSGCCRNRWNLKFAGLGTVVICGDFNSRLKDVDEDIILRKVIDETELYQQLDPRAVNCVKHS